MKFNIYGTVPSSSRTSYTVTISGVTSVAAQQIISVSHDADTTGFISLQRMNASSGELIAAHASGTTTQYGFSGDVELASKPTFI